jgi:hypothetical protein
VGKHVRFDGRYLHGVPEELLRTPGPRVTFLVNIWINRNVMNIKPFPEVRGGDALAQLLPVCDYAWHDCVCACKIKDSLTMQCRTRICRCRVSCRNCDCPLITRTNPANSAKLRPALCAKYAQIPKVWRNPDTVCLKKAAQSVSALLLTATDVLQVTLTRPAIQPSVWSLTSA